MNNREPKDKAHVDSAYKNIPDPCKHVQFSKYCKSCRYKRKEEEKGLTKKEKFEQRKARIEKYGAPKKYHKSKAEKTEERKKKLEKKRDEERDIKESVNDN